MFDIEEELKKLPGKPGVYLMHDEKDEIIYVGKAISLKNRVRQYFQSSRGKTAKINKMVSKIARFEYIVTDSEMEALVLECNLIKEHRPRYNTMLKDDKSYPYIKVTVGEAFPRVLLSRDMKRDKSRYFGPYTSVGAVKDSIGLIHRLYKLRTCRRRLPEDIGKERPCLNYHIKQCNAPCQGYIDEAKYRESIHQVLDFLGGHYETILKKLERDMKEAAEALEFEEAAALRELLFSVQKIAQTQKITDSGQEDRDIIAYATDGPDAVVQIFFMREGKLIGRDNFHLVIGEGDGPARLMTNFVKQFYAGTPFIPKALMLQHDVEESERGLLEQWLSEKRGQKVTIHVPKKGEKARLMEMAEKNASIILKQDREKIKKEEQRTVGAVRELEEILGLSGLVRMEAFDISNISGFQSVGSMIVYENGRPKRTDYRKFRIQTVEGPNDYASMEEVLTRRFLHGKEEKEGIRQTGSFDRFPDILMMDGGKGQVSVAKQVLEKLGLTIPVCGMVKDDAHRTRALYFEGRELPLDRRSEGFKLLTRIQDEAHRFAIEYHRSLRGKDQVHSILEDIKGIGPTRRKALMRTFGTMEKLRAATVEELSAIPQMNEQAAESVYNFFHKNSS
ncbi:MAG: excinuclease ABC subunit UvrC [Lachnospiraceae bacterium]|nr:excinuclease ABC subunit UvrC [Lachnospiraceae bacterium]